ncbi:hypothetical protein A2U01_0082918, partial [Trifolium medium]|nr:hypothetical protein [Trifolium medium]
LMARRAESVLRKTRHYKDGAGVYKRSTGLASCQQKNWHLTIPRG